MADTIGEDATGRSNSVSQPKLFNDYVFQVINSINTDIGFGIFKLGALCDAKKSYTFQKARCDLEPASICPDAYWPKPHYHYPKIMTLGFHEIFSKGFSLLQNINSGNCKWEDVTLHDKKSLEILETFLKHKEYHLKCLKAIINANNATEQDVTIVLAEHLLRQLSPGQSYYIDERSKNKQKCSCGCNASVAYGKTGIGDGRVWHGYLDLIFSSHDTLDAGDVAVTTLVPKTKEDTLVSSSETVKISVSDCEFCADEDEDEEQDVSDDSSNGLSMTLVSSDDTDDQIIAQAIVFSLMQKCRHPNYDEYLIPTIAISTTHFRIVMYDSKKDILIRSEDIPIFFQNSFVIGSIAILWMVLHYRIFCSGVNLSNQTLDHLKSGFMDCVPSCRDIYLSLNADFVSVFEEVEQCNANLLIKSGLRVYQDLKNSVSLT